MATLGISTNTRLVSMAIISQHELVGYGTHLYKSSWSPAKRDRIIASLEPCVRQYCIKRVVLSIPYAHHQTKAHASLMEALQAFFQTHQITVLVKTPEAFAPFCGDGKKKRKKELMQALVKRFPELQQCYLKELRNKKRYYFKLFEAVAVALLAEAE